MNPKAYFSIVIVSLVLTGLVSCKKDMGIEGSGKIIHDIRSVTGFDGLSSEGDYDVNIVEDAKSSTVVEVVADDNFLPYISTSVSNNTLYIKTVNNHYFKGERVVINITVPKIVYIDLAGSGFMTCDNVYEDYMDVNLSGSGNISMFGLDVTKNLTAKITGSGEIELRGKADAATFEITGSGSIKGYTLRGKLQVNDCTVKISGSGDVFIYVYNNLNVYISGSGDVFYRYHPTIFQNIPGDGSIINDN